MSEKICGSKGFSDPIKVWLKKNFYLRHKPQIWNFQGSTYEPWGW